MSNEVPSSRYISMIWSLIVCVLADKNWKNKHFLCMISLYFWELKIRIDIGIACSELNFFPWPRGIILCMKCDRRFMLLRLCDSPNVSKCFLWIIFLLLEFMTDMTTKWMNFVIHDQNFGNLTSQTWKRKRWIYVIHDKLFGIW